MHLSDYHDLYSSPVCVLSISLFICVYTTLYKGDLARYKSHLIVIIIIITTTIILIIFIIIIIIIIIIAVIIIIIIIIIVIIVFVFVAIITHYYYYYYHIHPARHDPIFTGLVYSILVEISFFLGIVWQPGVRKKLI